MYKEVKFIVILSIMSFNTCAQLDEVIAFIDYSKAPELEDGVDLSKISTKFFYKINGNYITDC